MYISMDLKKCNSYIKYNLNLYIYVIVIVFNYTCTSYTLVYLKRERKFN